MNENRYMDAVTLGIYLLGVKDDEKVNFMTAAWLTQISSSPKTILVAVGKNHYTAEMIRNAKQFSVNVLAKGQEELAKKCGSVSGRNTDKSAGMDYELEQGVPVVKDTAAVLKCTLEKEIKMGDHVLFAARVEDGCNYGKTPLTYNEKQYF